MTLALGSHWHEYPRGVAVDVSDDGVAWIEVWQGEVVARTVAAAVDDPGRVPIVLRFPPRRAEHVRIRQTGVSPASWVVAELRISGEAVPVRLMKDPNADR